MRNNIKALIVIAGLVAVSSLARDLFARDRSSSETEARLAGIAEEAIRAELDMLVFGATATALDGSSSGAFAQAISWKLAENAERQRRYSSAGIGYTGYETTLHVTEVTMTGEGAIMTAEEYTVLHLAGVTTPGAPMVTEMLNRHVLTFVKAGDAWMLVSDVELDAEPPIDWPRENGTDLAAPPAAASALEFGETSETYETPFELTAILNRSANQQYAWNYWKNYNDAFRRFDGEEDGGDCTNFVSQALRAGNWFDVGGWYRSPATWFYNAANQSWSWVGVTHFYNFSLSRPRSNLATRDTQLRIGDVLQLDWTGNGSKDHSMIVTAIPFPEIYLTYHSPSRMNKRLSELRADYPRAYLYRHVLSSTIK